MNSEWFIFIAIMAGIVLFVDVFVPWLVSARTEEIEAEMMLTSGRPESESEEIRSMQETLRKLWRMGR